jgi:hypothetical protein
MSSRIRPNSIFLGALSHVNKISVAALQYSRQWTFVLILNSCTMDGCADNKIKIKIIQNCEKFSESALTNFFFQ